MVVERGRRKRRISLRFNGGDFTWNLMV